jgi:hypothetical protein
MKPVWYADLKGEDQKRFKENVLGSKIVLDKLIKICYNYINGGEKVKLEDFDSPSWAYRAAFVAGEAAAYRKIIEVLTVDDTKEA